jgi:hypothetical protein
MTAVTTSYPGVKLQSFVFSPILIVPGISLMLVAKPTSEMLRLVLERSLIGHQSGSIAGSLVLCLATIVTALILVSFYCVNASNLLSMMIPREVILSDDF